MSGTDFTQQILLELHRSGGQLTATDAAALVCRSPVCVRHAFTRKVGMSFRVARLRARMEHACQLLLQTRLTIVEISLTLGYSDRTKLEKAFKRAYGMTPTQFRHRSHAAERSGKMTAQGIDR
jgi:AraC-like DNA-binding protein